MLEHASQSDLSGILLWLEASFTVSSPTDEITVSLVLLFCYLRQVLNVIPELRVRSLNQASFLLSKLNLNLKTLLILMVRSSWAIEKMIHKSTVC